MTDLMDAVSHTIHSHYLELEKTYDAEGSVWDQSLNAYCMTAQITIYTSEQN